MALEKAVEADVGRKSPLRKGRSLIAGVSRVDRDIGWQTLIDQFLKSKEAGGTRDSTIRSYKYDLAPWQRYCDAHSLACVFMIKTRDVENYLLEQKQQGKAIASRRNRGIILQQL